MNYTPTRYDTAQAKEQFVSQFMRFVDKNFPKHLFTKKLYNRLMNMFGHIAHYNHDGFWDTFFTSTKDKVRFLEQTMNYPCYGSPESTWCDAEKEIQNQIREKKILEKWQFISASESYSAEYAEYLRLKEKFEA